MASTILMMLVAIEISIITARAIITIMFQSFFVR